MKIYLPPYITAMDLYSSRHICDPSNSGIGFDMDDGNAGGGFNYGDGGGGADLSL